MEVKLFCCGIQMYPFMLPGSNTVQFKCSKCRHVSEITLPVDKYELKVPRSMIVG